MTDMKWDMKLMKTDMGLIAFHAFYKEDQKMSARLDPRDLSIWLLGM